MDIPLLRTPQMQADYRLLAQVIEQARMSPCSKLKYGAIAIHGNFRDIAVGGARGDLRRVKNAVKVVSTGFNRPIPPTAFMCETRCIREDIPSRTFSMLGGCCHAEELAIWQLVRQPSFYWEDWQSTVLYVAGMNQQGIVLETSPIEFTCLRCATQMALAGILGVNVWAEDGWHFIGTDQAVNQAYNYYHRPLNPDWNQLEF